MTRPIQITIDLSALRHNLENVRRRAPQSKIIAMVKSNAYGHGLERVALALQEADTFGVACFEEGLKLRKIGILKPIVLMEGIFDENELGAVVANEFTLVVHQEHQVIFLEKNPQLNPISVWLKIDSGMNRLGFSPEEAESYYQRLLQCDAVKKPIGLMTHFAEADAMDPSFTKRQIDIFEKYTSHLKGPRSLANSAAILAYPETHADYVRPGIMLYGASPLLSAKAPALDLKPAMALSSKLIAVKEVKKGERIGYGGIWTCPENMLIGVVAAGYGDGYPRHVREGAPILVNNRICPLIGRVSMDMLTVDLRTQPEAKIGDSVLLWGPGLPVEVVAEFSETNSYELLTRITQRVRVQVQSEAFVC